ncbi:MAG: UDP-N-acetylglucosamine--N-acetylmuramyl-(pentapeptide) pyrophosphoryl-undecaprenol N-acetylglucosamine transferase [Mesorhizobium amorphae]|nr:MAG: UDP-N-acetylglucosamine--N-acetylmuramyl-(pentapeptide) pyrophosphoryl-undecaprenol N-acetylglucosamine transferase [Mesorhizobium amorphae]
MAARTILLAAGGTGGHLFPAEALAHELKTRGWAVHLVTDTRAERFAGRFPAEAVHALPSATIGGRNPVALARALWKIWQGSRGARKLFAAIRPAAVVGFGGYPTLPPLWTAARAGLPTVIHEQNAVMGRANRALASQVKAIAGGFLGPDGHWGAKTVVVGNPVRPAVIEAARVPYAPSHGEEPFSFVVFGGSQGAQFFSEAVPAAIERLPDALRKRLRIVQQARKEEEAGVRAAYARMGVAAEVSPFFADMAGHIAGAHLLMTRAGASTVSELAVIGRPAMLVPYPHALDHDQAANAQALAAVGGAEVHLQATLSPEVIAEKLAAAMGEPERLAAMAAAAKGTGRPDAARLLADLVEAIAAGKQVSAFKESTHA